MSYSAYTKTQTNSRRTSATSSVSAQTSASAQFGSKVACLLIVSTSVPSPSAFTSFESATNYMPIVRHSALPVQETDREDLSAIARIRTLGTYKAGWAGPESVGPVRSTVEQAEEFARYLFSLGAIYLPYISASGDGEINFYWKKDEFMLDLGFTGEDFYSYYAQLPNGQEVIENAAALNAPLPKEIVDIITQAA